MKKRRFPHAVVCFILLVSTVCSSQSTTGSSSSGRNRFRLYGDWDVKWDGMDVILTFSRDEEGELTAQWIMPWGSHKIDDIQLIEGGLSYPPQKFQIGTDSVSSSFHGTIEEGKLTGTLSYNDANRKVTGKPSRTIPRAVGSWEMKFKVGEREYTSTLHIKTDKEGKFSAEMKSERVEHTISDVQYERGKLTFKRKTKMGDREWESTFEGNIDWRTDTLSGKVKFDRGESTAEGKRIGSAVIGSWDLDMTTIEDNTIIYKQRLKINRDMSGLYGTIPIKKVILDGDKVTCNFDHGSGAGKSKFNFEGMLDEGKLRGVLNLSGADKATINIVGTKAARIFRRRRGNNNQ